METTFKAGGYYRYTLVKNPKMAMLVINANYWSINDDHFQAPDEEAQ